MGIGDRVGQFASQVQDGVKSTSVSFFTLTVKFLTSFFLGVLVALVAQEVIQYGTLAFVFMMLVMMGLSFKLMSKWTLGATLVFDLIFVLIATLLRMYILLAP